MIYDCFTFFNELDLLELRLNELDPVVDRFVLVEATRTFSGKPKPLVFEAEKSRFERFLSKVEHVVVRDLPSEPASAWEREAAQRDAILSGLSGARPNDVVLVSDVDEIPRAAAVRHFVEAKGEAASFYMPTFYYKLNVKNVRGEVLQPLTVALRRSILRTPQEARLWRFGLPGIPDAGWHFSYLGDVAAIQRKIEAFSHQEFNTPEVKGRIAQRVERSEDLFGRANYSWGVVPIDTSFPDFVRANPERFGRHIAQPEPHLELRGTCSARCGL